MCGEPIKVIPHPNDEVLIITELDEDLDAWSNDDAAEEAFRKFVDEFNKRPISHLEQFAILEEAYGDVSRTSNDNELDLEPIELNIITYDLEPSEEVTREIKSIIDNAEKRSNIRNNRHTFLGKLLGLE
jgi:hypothetical protein